MSDRAWMAHAACLHSDPELFFPEGTSKRASTPAIAVCRKCPVQPDCLTYAIRHDIRHGVWGGYTPFQRDARAANWRAAGRAATHVTIKGAS